MMKSRASFARDVLWRPGPPFTAGSTLQLRRRLFSVFLRKFPVGDLTRLNQIKVKPDERVLKISRPVSLVAKAKKRLQRVVWLPRPPGRRWPLLPDLSTAGPEGLSPSKPFGFSTAHFAPHFLPFTPMSGLGQIVIHPNGLRQPNPANLRIRELGNFALSSLIAKLQ